MTDKTRRRRWDIGRFLQTLNFFKIIPVVGSFPQGFGGRNSLEKIAGQVNLMNVILIINATDDLGRVVIQSLLPKGLQIRAIADDLTLARQQLDNRVELLRPDAPYSQLMGRVIAVIYCFEPSSSPQQLQKFIELSKNHFSSGERILFDFAQPNENLREIWGAVDDVVMGGVSESNIHFVRSRAIFSGNVSTANNGGFASVRTRNFIPPLDLSAYEGIELRVEGDGKRYKFITRCEEKWDGLSYCYSFDTIYNFPQTIQVPFKDLIPVFRAKTVDNVGAFDRSKVYSMQLMQSKFEYDGALNSRFSPGLFGLEIETIKAYGGHQTTLQFILASPSKNLAVEELLENSGLNYTIIYHSPAHRSSIGQYCWEILEKNSASVDRILEI